METHTGQQAPRIATPERLTPSELKRMIIKLRWIGMSREAERLGTLLGETGHTTSVLATPRETD